MSYWLHCIVLPGQFSGEYAIKGQMFNEQEFSLFVPEEYVQCDEEPALDKPIAGMINVEVIEEKGDLRLVLLPRQAIENGNTVTVCKSQIEFQAA